MPFNINSFKTNIEGYGYLKNNHFEVLISPPRILLNGSVNNLGTPTTIREINNNLKFRIEQVRAPGINLISADINRYGIGPTQKQPFNAQFSETTFSILSDGYGEIWQYWYNWLRAIFEFNGTDSSRVGPANSVARYTTEYKDNYSTTMQIVIYDTYGNAIQRINLFEAFPTSLREVQLSWGDAQNLLRLNVSITFSEFHIVGTDIEGGYGYSSAEDFRSLTQRAPGTLGLFENSGIFTPSLGSEIRQPSTASSGSSVGSERNRTVSIP
jgi:hypothetical protein